ncbi:hypothetical protein [Rufibacter roseus]|uniref:Uncharacterized protein n=1 Tax=Rufibacter roseus TaxID=1567108 RepID=A0ABW2DP87_9BACT|nr:hypothetical protein [Rufibacter roseus]
MKVPARLLFLLSLAYTANVNGQTLASPPALPATSKVVTPTPKPVSAPAPKPMVVSTAPKTLAAPKPQVASTTSKVQTVATSKPAAAPSLTPDAAEAPVVKLTAAESKIQQLITEREQLVLKYDYLKAQENSFWGNASKKDMKAVIDALKEVLQKDTEIIHAVSEQTLEARRLAAKRAAELEYETKRIANQVQGDKRLVTDNIFELKASLENSRNLVRRREKQIKDLEEKLVVSADAKFEHDAIAAFFAMLSLVLVGYISWLRGKLNRVQAPKKKLKKA